MSLLDTAPAPKDAAARVREAFSTAFSHDAEGVFSAPGRVNIIGEHVDYQNGLCLPMAIEHRCFVAAARTSDGMVRMRSLQSPDEVVSPFEGLEPGRVSGWAAYVAGVVWALREELGSASFGGVELLISGDVPLGAGLSSSAALECCVAEALEDLYGLGTSQLRRIRACIEAETTFAGASTGGLDQSASILATEGHALLLDCVDFSTTLVPWDLAADDLALLIVDTRATHSLVGGEYSERRAQAEEAARLLGVDTLRDVDPAGAQAKLAAIEDEVVRRRGTHIVEEIERVRRFAALLEDGGVRANLAELGALLNASHDSLRDNYQVTVDELDVAVDAARAAGAHGARMTGGGFGGSIIALVDSSAVESVAQAVAAAFEAKGFTTPKFFVSTAGPGARAEQ